ncbi:MAG TPA: hypothetical protein DCR59_01760, partial [Dehalococcoidia bacterium]|nr:hypothetical protein [Dehalococcoidia bacterium]
MIKYSNALKTYRPHTKRRPTTLYMVLSIITLSVLAISLLLFNLALVIACSVIAIYLICLTIIILKRSPGCPVKEEQIEIRILAGNTEEVEINLNPLTNFGMALFFESENDWVKVKTKRIYLKHKKESVQLSITPALSGPSFTELKGYAIDQWGLFQSSFKIEPVKLVVVPRARFAS